MTNAHDLERMAAYHAGDESRDSATRRNIRAYFTENSDGAPITAADLFEALEADPEYWERKRRFERVVSEMIEAGELDTYGGELTFVNGDSGK